MKKIVLKLNIYDEKSKQKAMKAASALQGINSIAVDLKDRKMTVIGEVDPVEIAVKMRKSWRAEIVLVEPEKKDVAKKNETSGGNKKPDGGGGGGGFNLS